MIKGTHCVNLQLLTTNARATAATYEHEMISIKTESHRLRMEEQKGGKSWGL